MRLGSMRMRRTSAGVARMRIDMSIALMQTDLPVPVVPAMSRCGMRGEVGEDRVAGDVLADAEQQRAARRRRRAGEHVAERDRGAAVVGDLDADERLARDRREDADGGRRERQREVVGERGDPVDLARPWRSRPRTA